MFPSLLVLASAASLWLAPSPAPARSPLPIPAAALAGGEIVQSGTVFTGVSGTQGKRKFTFPITMNGFAPGQGTLRSVQVSLDVRMSGEYTIRPTSKSPNGIVEAHSTTRFVSGLQTQASVQLDFTPIPWVFPVNFPLNILWAKDGENARVFTDTGTLNSFRSSGPISRSIVVDMLSLVSPPGWANPHLSGVLATWEVRYVYE